jgi:hypothetical protein
MSSIVKTVTPFLNRELLLQALDSVGCKYAIQENEIVMLQDQRQRFTWDSAFGRFKFSYYSHNYSESEFKELKARYDFLGPIEQSYNDLFRKKRDEELERERKAFVEKEKAHIIAKAKEKGYEVREEMVKEKVKLVLVKTTY